MNTTRFINSPWLVLSLLGGEYSLLGWYLAAHHIFWLVSAFVLVVTLALAWKSNLMPEFLASLFKQPLFVVIGVSFLLSVVIVSTLVNSIFSSLFVLPLLTLLYAFTEMQAAGFKQSDIFLWSAIITGVGLGLGETIDLFVLPSMRY